MNHSCSVTAGMHLSPSARHQMYKLFRMYVGTWTVFTDGIAINFENRMHAIDSKANSSRQFDCSFWHLDPGISPALSPALSASDIEMNTQTFFTSVRTAQMHCLEVENFSTLLNKKVQYNYYTADQCSKAETKAIKSTLRQFIYTDDS
jgi:hypothetical protein